MTNTETYLPILVLLVIAAAIAGVFIFLSWFIGPKKNTPYKQAIYECGVQPIGDTKHQFPIKFYLVAILFILFDIEIVFLWTWITVFKDASLSFQLYSFTAIVIYMVLWVIGDAYVIKSNAIDWDEGKILQEKLMDKKQ